MPKFVPMFDVPSSSSDDEIEIIPYVKPPPPVIELLFSSSGEDEEPPQQNEEEGQNKPEKKKKRKKKREDLKQIPEDLNNLSITNDCADNNNPLGSSGSDSPKSRKNGGKNNEIIPDNTNNTDIIVPNGSDNVQDGNNNAELVLNNTPESENAAVPAILSGIDIEDVNLSSDTNEPLPILRISSSIFDESETSTLDQQLVEPILSNTAAAADKLRNIAAGTKRGKKVTQSSTSTTKKSLANAVKAVKAKASPKPRAAPKPTKHRIASIRTNQEIYNFLTTLGIPLEPQDLETNKRVRKVRTKSPNKSPGNGLSLVADISSSATVAVVDHSLGAFVSVTEESNLLPSPSTSKKTPKKRIGLLKNRTTNGIKKTLSLENLTFTKDELNKINLNMTTNIVFASDIGVVRQTSPIRDYEEMTSDPVPSTSTSTTQSKKPVKNPAPSTSSTKTVPLMSLSLEKTPRTSEGRPLSLDSVSSEEIANPSQEISQSKETELLNKSLNQLLREKTNIEKALAAVIPDPDSAPSTLTRGDKERRNFATESNSRPPPPYFESDLQPPPPPSYLASHFTDQMVKFYDTIRDSDLQESDRLRLMSNNPKLWQVRWAPTPPRVIKRVRCMNCNQLGHLTRSCTEKKKPISCRVCGSLRHMYIEPKSKGRRSCPNAKCLNCGREQYTFTSGCQYCMNSRRPMECSLCRILGHEEFNCPDNWRRFHSTTTAIEHHNPEATSRPPERTEHRSQREMYCSNCARKGHTYYNCNTSHRMSLYHRNKPYIVKELPVARQRNFERTAASTRDTTPQFPERTVSLQPQSSQAEIIQVRFTNEPASSHVTSADIDITSSPRNSPKKRKITPIKDSPESFKEVIGIIDEMIESSAAAVDPSSSVGHDHDQEEEEGLNIQDQKSSTESQPSSDQMELTLDEVKSDADKDNEPDPIIMEFSNNPSPEVITLEDDEDEQADEQETNLSNSTSEGSLNVALLDSEWEHIFSESTKPSGLTAQLTSQFGVNIFVCKENLTCTIQSGTPENRKLAQQNIVFWLECSAANVKYSILLGKDDYDNHFKSSSNSNQVVPNKNNSKRPRNDPKPNNTPPTAAKRRRDQSPRNGQGQNGRWQRGNRNRGRGQFNNNNRGQSYNREEQQQNQDYNNQNPRSPRYFQNQQILPHDNFSDFSNPNLPNPFYQPNNNRNNFNNNNNRGRGNEGNYPRQGGSGGNNNTRGAGGGSNRGGNKGGGNNRLRYYNAFI